MKRKNTIKLKAEFKKFQYEFHDLLKPYFEALELRGDQAFERYEEIYNETFNAVSHDSRVGDFLFLGGASVVGLTFLFPVMFNKHWEDAGFQDVGYNKRLKSLLKETSDWPTCVSQRTILRPAQAYKKPYQEYKAGRLKHKPKAKMF